jgi:hypothetical protein
MIYTQQNTRTFLPIIATITSELSGIMHDLGSREPWECNGSAMENMRPY